MTDKEFQGKNRNLREYSDEVLKRAVKNFKIHYVSQAKVMIHFDVNSMYPKIMKFKEPTPDTIPEYAELIEPVLERWMERRKKFFEDIYNETN